MIRANALKLFSYGLIACCIIFLAATADAAKDKTKQAKPAPPPPKPVFGIKNVVNMARMLSLGPYQDPKGKMPQWLLDITYDQHRDIRFIPEKSFWRTEKLPFELQFFHAGFYFDRTVKINTVTPQGQIPINFSPDYFNLKKRRRSQGPGAQGFGVCRIPHSLQCKQSVLQR
jgi:glucans biosynthesis protein